MTKATVHDCVVEIHRPSGDYVGQVAEGKFTYENGVVSLCDRNGTPIGKTYAQKINPDESPVVVARRLTKKFYFARRGGKDDFNRPLES